MKDIYSLSLNNFQILVENYIYGKYKDNDNIFHGKTIFLKKLTLSEINKPLTKLIYHENTVNYKELDFWKKFLSRKVNNILFTELHINYKFGNLVDMSHLFSPKTLSKPYYDFNFESEVMYIWFGEDVTF